MSYAMQRGLGFVNPKSLLERMDQVNDEISSLDSDVQATLKPGGSPLTSAFPFNEWNDFTNGEREAAANFELAPPRAWRWFYTDNSGAVSRLFNSEAISKRTSEFELRFIELYDKFVAANGKPALPRPSPFLVPKSPEDRDKWITYAKIAAVLGGLVAVGYFLRSVPGIHGGSSTSSSLSTMGSGARHVGRSVRSARRRLNRRRSV